MEIDKPFDVSITARGIEDAPLILLTQEMMRVAGVRLTDRDATNSREAALETLATLAAVARKMVLAVEQAEELKLIKSESVLLA